jgi:hypothetical protein
LARVDAARFYHRDPCEHRIAAVLADHYQHFGCRLPFRRLLFNFGQLSDEERGVSKVTSGTEDVLHCRQETHHKLDLTVRKLPPVLDGCRVTALRRLLDDFARFAASSVNRQCEYLWFPNAGHSVGQITRADEHVTPLLGYYAYS